MSEQETLPRVAAPHECSGDTCDFCEWSNPTFELPITEPRKG